MLGGGQAVRDGLAQALRQEQPVERLALDQVFVRPAVDLFTGEGPQADGLQQRLEPGRTRVQRGDEVREGVAGRTGSVRFGSASTSRWLYAIGMPSSSDG